MCDKNENKVYTKQLYTCAICGESYSDVQDRMNCEMKCIAKQKEEARMAAEAKKKEERDARFTAASNAIDNALTLVNKCIEDYGSFSYTGKLKDSKEPIINYFPSRIWHRFFF